MPTGMLCEAALEGSSSFTIFTMPFSSELARVLAFLRFYDALMIPKPNATGRFIILAIYPGTHTETHTHANTRAKSIYEIQYVLFTCLFSKSFKCSFHFASYSGSG